MANADQALDRNEVEDKDETEPTVREKQQQALQAQVGRTPLPEIRWSEEVVDQRIDRFLAISGAFAHNTMRAWRADWSVWSQFCEERGYARLPATVEALERFLDARIIGLYNPNGGPPVGMSREVGIYSSGPAFVRRATLARSLATLRKAHQMVGLPFAGDTVEGTLALRSQMRRLPKRQQQHTGLTRDVLLALLEELPTNSLQDLRDRAAMWMLYSTLGRRSEVVKLALQDMQFDPDGAGSALLLDAKTDQEAQGVRLYLRREAVRAIRDWVDATGIVRGPLLRALQAPGRRAGDLGTKARLPDDQVPADGPEGLAYPMTDHNVARIIKRMAEAAGMTPAAFSGHSARIGAAQEMAAAGFTVLEIMQAGRWKSEAMVLRYTEHLMVKRGAAAKLEEMQSNRSRRH